MARRAYGRIEVICGCMFSGKTTELIRRLRSAERTGRRVVGVKPAGDTRSGASAFMTHHGETLPASSAASASEVCALAADAEVVGVDEAHFFGADLAAVVIELAAGGRRVLVAGVDRDHRGEPFEPFPSLLCEADETLRLTAACAKCGRPATHSQRMVLAEDRIVVGGAGMYEARCRRCFEPGTA